MREEGRRKEGAETWGECGIIYGIRKLPTCSSARTFGGLVQTHTWGAVIRRAVRQISKLPERVV
jgi:hypothetical protein